jgi:hypothetical protein
MAEFLIWDTKRWKNGVNRTIYGHNEIDPYDSRLHVSSGTGRKLFIDGMGSAYLSGTQAKIGINAAHYDSKLKGIFTLNSTISTLSLRLRSRHPFSLLPQADRFAGYGCAVSLTSATFVREIYHDTYSTLDTVTLSTSLLNKIEYPMLFSVIDDGTTVDLDLQIDYGSGLTSVATATDSSPPAGATNKHLHLQDNYAFIRTNGTEPLDLKMREVEVYNIL